MHILFGKLSNYYDHLLRFFLGFQYFLIYMAKYFDRFLSFLTLITIQRDYAENTMSTKMPPKLWWSFATVIRLTSKAIINKEEDNRN